MLVSFGAGVIRYSAS